MAFRAVILRFSLRNVPHLSDRRYGLDNETSKAGEGLRLLQETANAFFSAESNAEPTSIRANPGQGIFIADPSAIPSADALELQEGDLLHRINGRSVFTFQQAGDAIQTSLNEHEENPSKSMSITFDLINGYDRRLVTLAFAGHVQQEVVLTRKGALGLTTIAKLVLLGQKKRAVEAGGPTSDRNLFITSGLSKPLSLLANDRFVTIEGRRIRSFDALEEAITDIHDRIESGEADSFEIVVHRAGTDQYITTTLRVE